MLEYVEEKLPFGRKKRKKPIKGFAGGKAWRPRVSRYVKPTWQDLKEFHYISSTGNGSTSPTGTILGPFTAMATGDTVFTRTGNSIYGLSFDIRFWLSYNTATANDFQTIRVLIVRDRHCAGGSPAVLDVLETTSILSYKNRDNSGRLQMLRDDTFVVSDGKPQLCKYKKYWFKYPYRVRFDGPNAADVQANHIYILLIDDDATANHPSYEYTHQFTFALV